MVLKLKRCASLQNTCTYEIINSPQIQLLFGRSAIFQMMKKFWLLVMIVMSSQVMWAQQDSTAETYGRKGYVTVRLHPARLLYGLNGGLDVRLTDRVLVGFLYQNYDRDFISPIRTLDIDLKPGSGYFISTQLYIESRQVAFQGPRIAYKNISFPLATYGDADDSEGTYDMARAQENWYFTYTYGYKRVDPGFYLSAAVTAGLVWFRATDEYTYEDVPTVEVEHANQIYPHVMLELAIGFTI